MDKFLILDGVFSREVVEYLADFDYGPPMPQRWVPLGELPIHEQLIDIARQMFDLSDVIGYEMWSNRNAIGWHYDHDEKRSMLENRMIYPPCSIVYYAKVDDLEGGDFTSTNIRYTPVTNRLVMFSPGLHHAVHEYTGTRVAISMNPWSYRP